MDLVRNKKIKDTMMNLTLQKMIERGALRKDHPLQRKPGRWSDSDRHGLIATVLKDEDFDSIKICEQLTDNGNILWVIDGLQRLTTLNSYFNNGFKLGKNVEFPIVEYQSVKKDSEGNIIKDEYGKFEYDTVKYDIRGKYYKDLPVELKEQFDNYEVEIVKHLDCTDEEIGYHIRRYNKQKSMNASENAVTFMDNMAKEVKRVSLNNKFFKNDTYKEIERNNGTIERIVTEAVMCMFHLDDWKRQSRKLGDFLNSNSSKQEFDKLNENLYRLEAIYDDGFKNVFTAKDSFIWLTLFDKFTKLNVEDEKFAEFIKEFNRCLYEKKINGEAFIDIDKNRSTKEKSVVIKKLNMLEMLMKEFLHIVDDEEKSIDGKTVESATDDTKDITAKEIVAECIDKDVDDGDMELYEMLANEISESIEDIDAPILSEENRPSFVAVAAYAAQKDREQALGEWIKKNHNEMQLVNDQKQNYLYMKRGFEEFCMEHRKHIEERNILNE